MKLKNVFSLILVMAIGLFSSCTDEVELNPNTETPVEVPEGKTALKIAFQGVGTKNKSYAPTFEAAGTQPENRIDSVYIFLFDGNKNDTLVGTYSLVAPEPGIDTTVLVGESSTKMKLVALANPADSIVTQDWVPYIGIIDLNGFKVMTTLQSDSMPKPSLLMSADGKDKVDSDDKIDMTQSAIQTATFKLERRVARIDIINRDSARVPADGQNHVFVLEKARLVNIPSTAYLHKAGTPPNASSLKNTDWEILDSIDGSTGTMYNQLYMYPKTNEPYDANDEVTLLISGKYNKVQAEYRIPFGNRNMLANNRYVVTLDSIRTLTVNANITIVDWETDTIKFTPDNGGAPAVTIGALPDNVTISQKQGDHKNDTIKLSRFSRELEFIVKSETVAPTISVNVDWIKVVSEEVISYSTDGFAKKYTLKFNKNPEYAERQTLLQFVNPLTPTERTTYQIVQDKRIPFPEAMPDWEFYEDLSTLQYWSENFGCTSGYSVPTANEYAMITPQNNWKDATVTTENETINGFETDRTGPALYRTGGTHILYGIKRLGTDVAYALEWKWVTGTGQGVTIRMLPVGKSLDGTATAASIKAALDVAGDNVTTFTFPNVSSSYVGYWSSTPNGANAWYFNVYDGYAYLYNFKKTNTRGVRCVLNK